MVESHIRSIVKAISWRFVATIITFTVAWILTRKLELAAQIGIFDTVLKLGSFYMHERYWNRLNFGRKKNPEYSI